MKAKIALALLLAGGVAGCGVLGGGDDETTPTIGNRTPILGRENVTEVDPALAGIAVVLPAEQPNAEWPQPGGNAAKAVGHVALPASLSRAWTAKIAGESNRVRLAAAPVVANGMVYALDTEARAWAFDATSGRTVWSQDLSVDGDGQSSVFGGGISADATRVYAVTGVGDVFGLDARSGAQQWKVRPAGPMRGAPTVSGGSIYAMTQDNQLYALAANSGATLWNEAGAPGQTSIFGVAAPSAAQGTIIAGYSTGELSAYRYENGRNLWTDALARTSISTSVSTLTDIDADPVIERGRVYAVGQGGRMASYDLVSGQRIWEINIAGISTPLVAGEWIFVMTDEGKLLAIARPSGRIRWMAQLPAYRDTEDKEGPISWVGPVLAGNRLIVASTEGELWSVSPGEGAANLMMKLDGRVSLSPVVANNMLYVLTDDGTIHAFR